MELQASPNFMQSNDRHVVLITGANGFVGYNIAIKLSEMRIPAASSGVSSRHSLNITPQSGGELNLERLTYEVRACIRERTTHNFPENIKVFPNLDLAENHDWDFALSGVTCIIHCAARVHIMLDQSKDPLSEFRKINVHATIALAKQAIAKKVKRFIFISSIKVNGENSLEGKPFTADDPVNPSDPYAISKMEAEKALISLAKESLMEIVIIRAPLIYGPGVKANFKTMINLINRFVPLPFNHIKNKRSLVSIDNLIDFIKLCIIHPKAANQIFLVADGQDLSTTELLIKIAKALNKPIFFLPIPLSLTKLFTKILTKNKINHKLFDNLQIDLNKNKKLLGWDPLIKIDSALIATINSFKNHDL